MGNFQEGDYVHVRCKIYPGAFPTEYLITLDTKNGVSSGFVPVKYVDVIDKPKACIEGVVRKVDGNTITVQLPGSYFTTAMGLTTFSIDWAKDNMIPAKPAAVTV